MLSSYGAEEDSWESLGHQGDQTSQSVRKSTMNIHRKEWCWSWNSNTLATWFEELTHWKRPWCWKRLKARGEWDDRGWDGWMASPMQWTWVALGVGDGQENLACCSPSCRRVGHNWATELNWLMEKKQTLLHSISWWEYELVETLKGQVHKNVWCTVCFSVFFKTFLLTCSLYSFRVVRSSLQCTGFSLWWLL